MDGLQSYPCTEANEHKLQSSKVVPSVQRINFISPVSLKSPAGTAIRWCSIEAMWGLQLHLTVNNWFNLLKLLLTSLVFFFYLFFLLSFPWLLFHNAMPTLTTISWILKVKDATHTFHMKENYFFYNKEKFKLRAHILIIEKAQIRIRDLSNHINTKQILASIFFQLPALMMMAWKCLMWSEVLVPDIMHTCLGLDR